MRPSYLDLSIGDLKRISQDFYDNLKSCSLCPRKCFVDRTKNLGFCSSGIKARISSYFPHFGEESFISGTNGSGTVFFCGCNLKCVFCQNYKISCKNEGYDVDENELANVFLKLQAEGCHNINLVTPTHFIPQILKALIIAVENGLSIPLIYNCGGYENAEVIKKLRNIIDIYMPDVKFFYQENSARYLNARNYFENVKSVLKEMHNQVGILKIKNGIALKGLLIRHLLMPNCFDDFKNIIIFISKEISDKTYINIMAQYRALWKAQEYPEINREITREEFQKAIDFAKNYLSNVYF